MVYNRDFVERNFGPSAELKGIFTLGEDSADSVARLAEAEAAEDGFAKHLAQRREKLQGVDGAGGVLGDLASLEKSFKDVCWRQKVKHDEHFAAAFQGCRADSEKFKARALAEHCSNEAHPAPIAELIERAKTVFGDEPMLEPLPSPISGADLLALEGEPILRKVVLGKQDIDIAEMINKLGNSDWVRQGRPFWEANGAVCPFCQQATDDAFAKSLADYFDESFVADSQAIADLCSKYATAGDALLATARSTLSSPSRFLDAEAFRAALSAMEGRLALNTQTLEGKKREPSRAFELVPAEEHIEAAARLVQFAIAAAAKHNDMVADIKRERSTLSSQVWRHILNEEIKQPLADYLDQKANLEKAEASLRADIAKAANDLRSQRAEIHRIEKASASVGPAVDAINGLLAKFGFHGFRLARSKGDLYTLNRGDGADAKHSLSEGERTFVTFLYFHHLLSGSDSQVGATEDRVVVFDDPVSSLDSEVLFIVATLVKSVLREVREGKGLVKQAFVLTHNAHFHKEVCFLRGRRSGQVRSDETYWVVRKTGLASTLAKHTENPIKSSYELLWSEARGPVRQNLSIQNTLRRILESYFKILGGVELHELPDKFEGADKVACASLVSWVNDGSHFVPDELCFSLDDAAVENQLRVFREVFAKWGHIAHYNMMMGVEAVAAPAVESATANAATADPEGTPADG